MSELEVNDDNLFGDIDADEVPDDPFYVGPDTYKTVLADSAYVLYGEDKDKEAVAFKWSVEDEDSPYYHNTVQDFLRFWRNIPKDELTPNMRKDNSRLKGRLVQMGLSTEEINDLLKDPETLPGFVGMEGYITVTESESKGKTWTNVSKYFPFKDDDEDEEAPPF